MYSERCCRFLGRVHLTVYSQDGFRTLGWLLAMASWRRCICGSVKFCCQVPKSLRTTDLEPTHHTGETKKCQVSFAYRFKAFKNINLKKQILLWHQMLRKVNVLPRNSQRLCINSWLWQQDTWKTAIAEKTPNQLLLLILTNCVIWDRPLTSALSPDLKTKALDSAIRTVSQNVIIIYDFMATWRENSDEQGHYGHRGSLDTRESVLDRNWISEIQKGRKNWIWIWRWRRCKGRQRNQRDNPVT